MIVILHCIPLKVVCPVGIEPTTNGLKDHDSTTELRAHFVLFLYPVYFYMSMKKLKSCVAVCKTSRYPQGF